MNDETIREILFRAKRSDNGKWVEGYLFKKHYQESPHDRFVIQYKTAGDEYKWTPKYIAEEIDESTICQYTGLTDKNGQKIWEHDFAFVTDGDGCLGQVDTGLGEIIFLDGLWYIDGHVQNALYDINRCFQIEVRGNAFDNPELLQEEEKDER